MAFFVGQVYMDNILMNWKHLTQGEFFRSMSPTQRPFVPESNQIELQDSLILNPSAWSETAAF